MFVCRFVLSVSLSCSAVLAQTLDWQSFPQHREAPLHVSGTNAAGFRLMPDAETGIAWTNLISTEQVQARQNLMNGSGVAAGDFDGDGLCDLYFCSLSGPNALFRNRGNWKFENVAEFAGVECAEQASTGAVFGDINGDGKLDLLVSSFNGPNACFLNLGGGRFTNITAQAGIASRGGATSMALGDLDGDGDLDLYRCHFAVEAILRDGGDFSVQMVNGRPVVSGRFARRLKIIDGKLVEFGDPDVIYRNDGSGRFTRLNWKETFRDENGTPMLPPLDFGLSVQIRDLNGDGLPDIYVCNDFQTPDRIWLNTGNGQFRALPTPAMRKMSFASMGADFADIDRDGRLDMFVVEMLSREHSRHLRQSSPMVPLPPFPGQIDREEVARNTLFWNRGDGSYAEIGWYSGLAASDWSWTPAFIDIDLDGFEDVLVTNGHLHDVNDRDVNDQRKTRLSANTRENRTTLSQFPRLATPNAAFRNQGGLMFADVSESWNFSSTQVSHGMALADLDNDGDQDVAVNCAQSPPLIYRNESAAPRIAVRLRGAPPNTQGIGGAIRVLGGPVPQSQEIVSGGRYLSGDDPLRTFAVGTLTNRLRIEVKWRSGAETIVNAARPNRLYEIVENRAATEEARNSMVQPKTSTPGSSRSADTGSQATNVYPTLFENVSSMLSHSHAEDEWDDFQAQPLLPRKLSRLGPGVAWVDLNADGRDDLVIGGARGGALTMFGNSEEGKLSTIPPGQPAERLHSDATGLAVWVDGSGAPSVVSGLLTQSTAGTNTTNLLRLGWDGATNVAVSRWNAAIGPVATADVDADGDLDLFVGGRFVPNRYPEPADSRLFRNESGRLVDDPSARTLLAGAGLVSGACFSDLNGDGFSELILACEWGPVRVLENTNGVFEDRTREWGLDRLSGFWTSIRSGDFDGDGRMDLVAGNWGFNSFYQRSTAGVWHLVYGEFNRDGIVHMIEAYRNTVLGKVVPFRDMETIGTVLPWLRARIESHELYAKASVEEILGDQFAVARELRANTPASTLFLNRGDKFEPIPLPAQAQWSPVFGIVVADFGGDGREDIFIAQNFSAVRPEDERQGEGRGLILLGDGRGGFDPLPASRSGILLTGDQRGAAVSDFDADGRVDIAVAQNDGPTQLFRNQSAAPGLRVRLRGSRLNPHGIGTVVRLESAGKLGPAREVAGGGGYWSQDSAVVVLHASEPVTAVWVRWPGGKTARVPVPSGAREIEVKWEN